MPMSQKLENYGANTTAHTSSHNNEMARELTNIKNITRTKIYATYRISTTANQYCSWFNYLISLQQAKLITSVYYSWKKPCYQAS